MISPDREGSTTPPKPGGDFGLHLILVAVAVAVHVWVIHNTSVTARDSIGFARYALNLTDPNAGRAESEHRSFWQFLRDEKHPPGYPALIFVISVFVRPLYAAPLPDQILRSAQVASALSAVLLVFPTFRLGRMLFDRTVGFWAALVFQLLPVVARDTSDGLSDGPFLLFVSWAVLSGVCGVTTGGMGAFARCGLAAGCAYLIRPEGLVVPVACGVVLWVAFIQRIVLPRPVVRNLLALSLGFLVVGGPYMLVIGRITNKPAMFEVAFHSFEPPIGGLLFAESISTDLVGPNRLGAVALACVKEWLKAAHYGVAVLAVVGLFLTWRRVMREPQFWFPVVYAVVHLLVVALLGYKKGYVSERHFLPVVWVGVVFAIGGLRESCQLWHQVPGLGLIFCWRYWPTVIAAGLALVGLPPLAKSLHENRAGHKEAGIVLRDELEALNAAHPPLASGVVIIDHYEWAQFYAERSLYRVVPDPPAPEQKVVYVVLELKDGRPETPTYQSERHRVAVAIFQDRHNPPEWVYHWPKNEPRERAKVVLVKQVRK
jgi:hypothetical protein